MVSGREQEDVRDFNQPEIVIGRSSEDFTPDLDLSPDYSVSRRHARIWEEDGGFWVEDLGSTCGTKVEGEPIGQQVKHPLKSGAKVEIGNTALRFETVLGLTSGCAPRDGEDASDDLPPKIGTSVAVAVSLAKAAQADGTALIRRQALLLDLPGAFASASNLDDLLQTILQRVVDALPAAERGALLLCDPASDALRLVAYVAEGEAAVSETLARRALGEGKGFLWRRNGEVQAGKSIDRHRIESGMYAPLVWKGKALGVICVDNPHRDLAFSDQDLRLFASIAHFASIAVAHYEMRRELIAGAKVTERLLANFSPKIRSQLIQKARQGRLRPGGEKSEVTLLLADLRGFTSKAAAMDNGDVLAMLNEYLPALADAVFQHDGSVDKYIGDAVLAVFGSPEPDPHQHPHALEAAFAMQDAMQRINSRRAERREPVCALGVGLHCGEVLHGFIGALDRLEFTVIGDPVNRVSRFCDAAKGGEILISTEMYQRVFNRVHAEKAAVKTKHNEELTAYRLLRRNA